MLLFHLLKIFVGVWDAVGFMEWFLRLKRLMRIYWKKCQFCSYHYPLLCHCCNAGILLLLLLQLPLLLSQLLSLPLLVNPTVSFVAPVAANTAVKGHCFWNCFSNCHLYWCRCRTQFVPLVTVTGVATYHCTKQPSFSAVTSTSVAVTLSDLIQYFLVLFWYNFLLICCCHPYRSSSSFYVVVS